MPTRDGDTEPGGEFEELGTGALLPVMAAADTVLDEDALELDSPSVLERALLESEEASATRRIKWLAAEVDNASEASGVAVAAYELGVLFENELLDDARASKAYRRALSVDPSLMANLWAVRSLFHRRELWEQAIKLGEAEFKITTTDRGKAGLALELGQIAEFELSDPQRALEQYRRCVDVVPQFELGWMLLERLALERQDDELLIEARKALLDLAPNDGERQILYAHIIDHYERMENWPQAIAACQAALSTHRVDERIADALWRIACVTKDRKLEIEALSARIEIFTNRISRISRDNEGLAGRLREVCAGMLWQLARLTVDEDREASWHFLQDAAANAPGDAVIIADMADLAESLGRFGELADLMAALEEREADPARLHILSLKRAVALARVGKEEDSIRLLQSLRARAPGTMAVVGGLEPVYFREQNWRGIAALYDDMAAASERGVILGPGVETPPEPQAAAWHYVAAGSVYGEFADNDEAAIECLNKALRVAPDWLEPVEALGQYYVRSGRSLEAVQCWREFAERTRGDSRQFALQRLLEHSTDLSPQDADNHRVWGLKQWCATNTTTVTLWRHAHAEFRSGNYRAAVTAWESIASLCEDGPLRSQCLSRAARICSAQLEDHESAGRLLAEALAADPNNEFSRALFGNNLAMRQRWAAVVAFLREEARRHNDNASWMLLAADIAEQNDLVSDAASILLEVLDQDPANETAILWWLSLDIQQRAETYAQVAQRVLEGEPSELVAHRLAERLMKSKPQLALLLLRRADSRSLLSLILRLEAATGCRDAEAYSEVLQRITAIVDDTGRRMLEGLVATIRFREQLPSPPSEGDVSSVFSLAFAAFQALRRGDAKEAIEGFRRLRFGAKRQERDDLAKYALLREVAVAHRAGLPHETTEPLIEILTEPSEPLLELACEVARSLGVAEAMTDDSTDSVEERNRVRSLAFRLAHEANQDDPLWPLAQADVVAASGDLGAAFELVRNVLARHPNHRRALLAMHRLAQSAGDVELATHCALTLVDLLTDNQARLGLLRHTLELVQSGDDVDPAFAASLLLRVVEIDPSAEESEILLELCESHDDPATMLWVLRHLEEFYIKDGTTANQQRLVWLLTRRARLRLTLGQLTSAEQDIVVARSSGPTPPETVRVHAEILEAQEDYHAAQSVRRAVLQQSFDEQLAADFVETAKRGYGDLEYALELTRSASAEVGSPQAQATILENSGEFTTAAKRWEAIADDAQEMSDRAEALRHAASCHGRAGELGAQANTLQRLLQIDPADTDAAATLLQLLTAVGLGDEVQAVVEAMSKALAAEVARDPTQARTYTAYAFVFAEQRRVDARGVALSISEALQGNFAQVPKSTLGQPLEESILARIAGPRAWAWLRAWSFIGENAAPLETEKVKASKLRDVASQHEALAMLLENLGLKKARFLNAAGDSFASVVAYDPPTLAFDFAALAKDPVGVARGFVELSFRTKGIDQLDDETLSSHLRGLAAAAAGDLSGLPSGWLGRRARNQLAELSPQLGEVPTPAQFRSVVSSLSMRLGALVVSDPSRVLALYQISNIARSLDNDDDAKQLLQWLVSDEYLLLRSELGVVDE